MSANTQHSHSELFCLGIYRSNGISISWNLNFYFRKSHSEVCVIFGNILLNFTSQISASVGHNAGIFYTTFGNLIDLSKCVLNRISR